MFKSSIYLLGLLAGFREQSLSNWNREFSLTCVCLYALAVLSDTKPEPCSKVGWCPHALSQNDPKVVGLLFFSLKMVLIWLITSYPLSKWSSCGLSHNG